MLEIYAAAGQPDPSREVVFAVEVSPFNAADAFDAVRQLAVMVLPGQTDATHEPPAAHLNRQFHAP